MAYADKILFEISEIIKDQVLDPNTDRQSTNKEWIFTDLKSHIGENLWPRILLLSFKGANTYHELGSARLRTSTTIEIQIRYKRSLQYQKNSEQYQDEEIVQKVADDILYLFIDKNDPTPEEIAQREANWERLRTNCNVFNIKVQDEELIYPEDFTIKIIRLELGHIR